MLNWRVENARKDAQSVHIISSLVEAFFKFQKRKHGTKGLLWGMLWLSRFYIPSPLELVPASIKKFFILFSFKCGSHMDPER